MGVCDRGMVRAIVQVTKSAEMVRPADDLARFHEIQRGDLAKHPYPEGEITAIAYRDRVHLVG